MLAEIYVRTKPRPEIMTSPPAPTGGLVCLIVRFSATGIALIESKAIGFLLVRGRIINETVNGNFNVIEIPISNWINYSFGRSFRSPHIVHEHKALVNAVGTINLIINPRIAPHFLIKCRIFLFFSLGH